MRPILSSSLLALCLLAVARPAACAERGTAGWSEESRTLREAWTLAGGRTVEVDNYSGPITVTAQAGDRVEAVIHETVAGRTAERLAAARQEVKLRLEQRPDGVHLVVDGPFRCRDGEDEEGRHGRWRNDWRGWEREGYKVTYAFELRVPREADLVLSTVQDGDVRVSGVSGRFDVHNVNGDVALERIGGEGEIATVNGPVRVSFATNPTGPSEFNTVNGDVDVAFRAGLDADLSFKTMNGEAFTEFDYTHRTLAAPAGDRRKGRFVLQRDGAYGIRIGAGGPELAFATINGDILVRNQDR